MNLHRLHFLGMCVVLSWVLPISGRTEGVTPSEKYKAERMNALRSTLPKYNDKESQPTPGREAVVKPVSAPKSAGMESESNNKTSTPLPVQNGAIELPKLVVHAFPNSPVELTHPIPRLSVEEKQKEVYIDVFTAGPERENLLIEKHLSNLDRKVLNRFFKGSLVARSRDAELREQNSNLLNHVAGVLEVDQQLGTETEEDRKIRKDYQQLLRERPR